ncbi:hypothetical protein GCM10010112_12980 [Actinoplanes lobatus]|uniref:LysR substrate-binding domain-containing protein n=1 Tax=Actinoplanes lobatus TaxID=113568 RepID=A0ABQ4AR33_9ACTN|nr:hypothetical protein GCM10010112_12980 [Actinoplanes lobatus]GIE43004.1 hypothetical protein Alo02nite_59020 [Actinoplanes lobatus]
MRAGSRSPRLRVALKADVDGGLLPRILDAYAADAAALPTELVLGGFGEQAQTLRDGRADVALVLCPFDDRGLDSEPLLSEPLLAALAAADPLAARTRLCRSDLEGRRLIGGPASSSGAARPASNLAEIFSLVETGNVVFLTPVSVARRYQRPGIAYRPVNDLPDATLAAAWPEDVRSPAVAAFVRAAGTVAAITESCQHSWGAARPAQQPAGDRSHDQGADDRAQDPAPVEDVVVADAQPEGEEDVPGQRTGQAEPDRDQPRRRSAHLAEGIARHEHSRDDAGDEAEQQSSDHLASLVPPGQVGIIRKG